MRGQHARRQRLAAVAVGILRRLPPARGRARARCLRAAGRRGAAASAPRSIRRWWIRRRPRPRRRRRSGRFGPARSLCTCAAVVGETWPDRLADGATTGPPNARRMPRATGWAGIRIATVSSPAVARSATAQSAVFGSTSVSGPGQNASASAVACGVETGDFPRGVEVADMGDQRIEGGPALGLIEPGNRGRRWRRRRRGHKRSRSGTRPARRLRRQAAAAATAASLAAKICVFRPKFTGIRCPQFGFLRCAKAKAISRVLVGVWLSPVEHCVRDAGVAGSNPATPTKSFSQAFCLFSRALSRRP